jgi:hypothetical protein
MTVALVAGALANKPGNGGAAWTRLSWTLGLAQLGFDVHFVEQIGAPDPAAEEWFAEVVGDAGLGHRATLLRADGTTATGLPLADLSDLAAGAAVLVNISGHLREPAVVERVGTRVFVDLDPGYTQIWHARGDAPLAPHDHWYSVGELVGRPACSLPTGGIRWRPVRQPVVLADWPVQEPLAVDRCTTVASWRGPFGTIEHQGRTVGGKVHEFRRFACLARMVEPTLELATDIAPADGGDRRRLLELGWKVRDAAAVAGGPDAFRRYVQGSPAELSVVQGTYVHTRTGWFSDRSVRYLASGRPVVVQDTGFSATLPVGEGLLAFTTPEEAARAVGAVVADPGRHARAARALAEEHFAAPVTLGRLCEEVGIAP